MELLEQIPIPLEKKTLKQVLSLPLHSFTSGFLLILCACFPCALLYTAGDFALQGVIVRFLLRPEHTAPSLADLSISIATFLVSAILPLYLYSLSYALVFSPPRAFSATTYKNTLREAAARSVRLLPTYALAILLMVVTAPIFFYSYIPLFLFLFFAAIKRESGQEKGILKEALKEGFRTGSRYWARFFGTFFILAILAILGIFISSLPFSITFLANQAASSYALQSGNGEMLLPRYYPALFFFCSLLKNWVYCFAVIYATTGGFHYVLSLLARRSQEISQP